MILPVTWHALSQDTRYGDGFLGDVIDLVKEMVFGEVISTDEENTYALVIIDYAAKLAAIELCTPGIDFWMNEPVSESATGTNENHTFIDRAKQLSELRKTLIEDTRRMAGDVAALLGFRRFSPRRPLLNTMNDELLTPSPQEFPRPYVATDFS